VSELGLTLVGLGIAVGIIGVVVPVLPGGILVWAAIAVWAVNVQVPEGWAVLAVSTLAIGATQVLRYVIPARRLRASGVPRASLAVGLIAGIAGFFLIPVVGLFLGFPVGIYLGERYRLRSHRRASDSTRAALKNLGLSILIELAGVLVAAAAWLVVVVATA
jgi:uncharacterized protein YqgC (DUF456 family)